MSLRIHRLVATFGGIGYLPLAPGTWAAAVTAILWALAVSGIPFFYFLQWPVILLCLFAGVYSSEKVTADWGKDPSRVVIDEVAGMAITLLMVPFTTINFAAGFILFRFFDILKPLGIRKAESLKGGWGIMMDDVLAGIYSTLLLHLLIALRIW